MASLHLRIWAAAIVALVVVSAGSAQTDPLEREKALRQVADQKTAQQVQEAVQQAEMMARVSPTKAVEQLKKIAESIDLNVQISSQKRKELADLVQAKIDTVQGKPATRVLDPKAKQRQGELQKEYEAGKAEAKEVKETVAEVVKLFEESKLPQAQGKIAALTKKYPNNPAVQVLAGQGLMGDRVIEARLLAREQEDRYNAALASVAQSALPPRGDMELAKNWKEIQARRDRLKPKLSPEEESILTALDQIVKQGVNNAPFEETVQQLSNLIDKPIYLDKASLEDAGLNMKRPVSIPANVTARTALRAILQSQGLTFIIKDKVIQVLTLERARETLVTRAYDIGDLVRLSGPFGGAVTWGPVADYQQTMANAEVIVNAIKAQVDPQVWTDKQGFASISFLYPGTIIVRAPAEVHVSLGKSLFK